MSENKQEKVKKQKSVDFTFGSPEPVLDAREILGYTSSAWQGDYYEPPISLDGLARSFQAGAHHASAIYLKRNILVSSYIAHPWLSKQSFSRLVLEFLVFGNAYPRLVKNRLGKGLKIDPLPAKFTRVAKDNVFHYVPNWHDKTVIDDDSVFHLLQPDINQEIYGVPEYLAALQSIWLNESATLFRRKYYLNNAHMGFIMYLTDENMEDDDVDNLRTALKDAKGLGNFKNGFVYSPGGEKDGLQLIPVSEFAAKDDFLNIKDVTMGDAMVAHRVPGDLMGVMAKNTGGYGNAKTSSIVFNRNELVPMQEIFSDLNHMLGEEVITFDPYVLDIADGVNAGAGIIN